MNSAQAKQISITDILDKLGYTPTRSNQNESWYLSPFRNEKTPSFKVNVRKNIYFDFGEGSGGTIIDFVMHYNNCTIQEALRKLKNESHSSSFHQQKNLETFDLTVKAYEVIKVKDLQNKYLLEYASSRKLNIEIVKKYCKEIHYRIRGKNYYGLGFRNDAGDYEVRNKYVKLMLGKKEISTIKNNQNSIILFEGWSDFISFLTLYPEQELKHDYIVLNSVSMLPKAIEELYNYTIKHLYNYTIIQLYNYIEIVCCFDNDSAGDKATLKLQNIFKNQVKDGRIRYPDHKDLNEYLIAIKTKSG